MTFKTVEFDNDVLRSEMDSVVLDVHRAQAPVALETRSLTLREPSVKDDHLRRDSCKALHPPISRA